VTRDCRFERNTTVFIAVVGNSMQKRWNEYEGAYVALEEIGDVGEAGM
jgi:hypothetical protein